MYSSQVLAKNRPSPYNEEEYIAAYKKVITRATEDDNYDIAAVVTISGINGHALMYYSYNRSKDNQYHSCYDFVSDDELKRYF